MKPYYDRDGITIYTGDNRDVLPHIELVHAVVTDPPYGLSFMGKGWDHSVPGVEFWQAIMAAMLPGAHLLAFGGTRTYHRMAVAIEDAGYEIRDTLQWIYGSGFPKSHDVSKAIDKMAGAEREVVGHEDIRSRYDGVARNGSVASGHVGEAMGLADKSPIAITAPATSEAEQWQGWGTALKPAYEPIIMARNPFKGTVAANVLQHGTGAINVDACRIGTGDDRASGGAPCKYGSERVYGGRGERRERPEGGRWPSNVILDEAAADLLDTMSGERPSRPGKTKKGGAPGQVYSTKGFGRVDDGPLYNDTGGASRFFYVAKASRRERNAGLEGMPERAQPNTWGDLGAVEGNPRKPNTGHVQRVQNHHPTVKPLALMRYLIQMVTPPGGIVLDPFAGSGSTLVAAAELGFHAIGIELSEEYAEIAARRVDHALNERAKAESQQSLIME